MSRLIDYLLPYLLTALIAVAVGFGMAWKLQGWRIDGLQGALAQFAAVQVQAQAQADRNVKAAQHKVDEIANEAAIYAAQWEIESNELHQQLAAVADRNRPAISPATRRVLQRASGSDGRAEGEDPPEPVAADGAAAADPRTGFISEAAFADYSLAVLLQWKQEAKKKQRLIQIVEELARTEACPIEIVEGQ